MNEPDPAISAAFYAQITYNKCDWTAYLMYADVLEECGLVLESRALHWQVKHKKRPLESLLSKAGRLVEVQNWYNYNVFLGKSDPESDLPEEIFERLHGARVPHSAKVAFETVREAEESFIAAFKSAVTLGTCEYDYGKLS